MFISCPNLKTDNLVGDNIYFKTTILALETLNLIGLDIFLWAFTEDRARTELGRRMGWPGAWGVKERDRERGFFF